MRVIEAGVPRAMDQLLELLDSSDCEEWSMNEIKEISSYDFHHQFLPNEELVRLLGRPYCRASSNPEYGFLCLLFLLARCVFEQAVLSEAKAPPSRTPRDVLDDELLVSRLERRVSSELDIDDLWPELTELSLPPPGYSLQAARVFVRQITLKRLWIHPASSAPVQQFISKVCRELPFLSAGDNAYLEASVRRSEGEARLNETTARVERQREKNRLVVQNWVLRFGAIARRREAARLRRERARLKRNSWREDPSLSEEQLDALVELPALSAEGETPTTAPSTQGSAPEDDNVDDALTRYARECWRYLQFRLAPDILARDKAFLGLSEEEKEDLLRIQRQILPIKRSDVLEGLGAHPEVSLGSICAARARADALLGEKNQEETRESRLSSLRNETAALERARENAEEDLHLVTNDRALRQMRDDLWAIDERPEIAERLRRETSFWNAEAETWELELSAAREAVANEENGVHHVI